MIRPHGWQTLATVPPSVHLVRSTKTRLSLSHQLARLYMTKLPTPISTSTLPQCSPRDDLLLQTTLALQHLAHVTTCCYGLATRSTPPRLTQRSVKTGISIYRPRRSSIAASSPHNGSLLRTALALQQLAYVDSLYQTDMPLVNPTNCQNWVIDLPTTRPTSASYYDRPAAFNDLTDLSCMQRSSSCIQRLDRPQLTHIKHLSVSPRLDLRQLPSTTTWPYQLSTWPILAEDLIQPLQTLHTRL